LSLNSAEEIIAACERKFLMVAQQCQFLINLASMRDLVPISYAAFLRGINVGGNKTVKMADVKKAFESLGFRDVKSVGASGNIVFASGSTDCLEIAETITAGLQKKLGLSSSAIVRRIDQLRKMAEADPFQAVQITPDIRLYVTFMGVPSKSRNGVNIPYVSPDNVFQILKLTKTEIFSVVDLSSGGSTLDAMEFLEKEFGKSLTTRNWNTIKKLVT
jgi:uncharacterized protein (DUF1697 family)